MLVFLFLDGVGLGSTDARVNPFIEAKTPFLEFLLGTKMTLEAAELSKPKLIFRHLDARLNYSGLPQSATGQTTLLTGKNGAEIMKGHYGPWPGPSLKAELDKGSLFTDIAKGKALLANTYPPGYFRALEAKKQKVNVPVYAAQQAGLALLTLEDYLAGRGISLDLTGEYVSKFGGSLFSPFAMGQRLNAMAQDAKFSFLDYWPSDSIGHRGSFAEAVALIEKLDAFIEGLSQNLDELTLLITSDHGNLEDKSVKTHTLAPVPLIALGKGAGAFETGSSLLDVAPAIRDLLKL